MNRGLHTPPRVWNVPKIYDFKTLIKLISKLKCYTNPARRPRIIFVPLVCPKFALILISLFLIMAARENSHVCTGRWQHMRETVSSLTFIMEITHRNVIFYHPLSNINLYLYFILYFTNTPHRPQPFRHPELIAACA